MMRKYLQIKTENVDAGMLKCSVCPHTGYVFSLDKSECIIEFCEEHEAVMHEEAELGKALTLQEAQILVASAAYTVPLEPSPEPQTPQKAQEPDYLAEFKARAS